MAKLMDEPLNIDAAELQGINCRGLDETVGAIRNELYVPKVCRKTVLPLGERRNQPEWERPDCIRADHDHRPRLSNLGTDGWLQVH